MDAENTQTAATSSKEPLEELAELKLTDNIRQLSDKYKFTRKSILDSFESFIDDEQLDLVMQMLSKMRHSQHGQINSYLRPMLQRDFITLLPVRGLSALAENILTYLDARSLCAVETVCHQWRQVVADGQLWKKLIESKVKTDSLWAGLADRRGWRRYLFRPRDRLLPLVRDAWHLAVRHYTTTKNVGFPFATISTGDWSDTYLLHQFYRRLYPEIVHDIDNIETNWKLGKHQLTRINCHSENSKGVYCLQYDADKIISGLRDNTIKIWDARTMQTQKVLTGHTGSVLCLQYDERVIISGSSDSTVRVWDVTTGEQLNTLVHHCEAVLHLRFQDGMMVTCSKDRSIAVWDMVSPREINLRRVLVGHRAAVNVVDFDQTYIVSASGDRTIKVWSADTCEFVRTLSGHKRGIACLQYREHLVVSGSSDNTIRLWDIESGQCLRVLEGHEELVRCIRFDTKRIVSGAYDGCVQQPLIASSISCRKIKVWDLRAALDPRSPPNSICLRTLVEHTGRVFRLQFDEFQIVSSSHDDTILIWDFMNFKNPTNQHDIPLVFSAHPEQVMMMCNTTGLAAVNSTVNSNNLQQHVAALPAPAGGHVDPADDADADAAHGASDGEQVDENQADISNHNNSEMDES